MNELFLIVDVLEFQIELRDFIVLFQEVELLGRKEIKLSFILEFEYFIWSLERVVEWISDLGFF